jgi:hypothetical protein
MASTRQYCPIAIIGVRSLDTNLVQKSLFVLS